MILDATAGNRVMWPNKNPPLTIFIDRELGLAVPPDIFADNRFCPFRDNAFTCVIYDPPHMQSSDSLLGMDPKGKAGNKRNWTWYGYYNSKRECLSNLHYAQKEFKRLTKRLCFKWSEFKIPLWNILPFFRDWVMIQKKEHKSPMKRSKHKTWWVTFRIGDGDKGAENA